MLELTEEFREKYVEVVEGRDFIRYDGLMELAHGKIASIETELLQAPYPGNHNMAIVKAIIRDTDGRVWSGIGDASDLNCDPELAPHKIRLAETRAKGRALRDMLNVQMPMFEEVFPKPATVSQTQYDATKPITQDQIMRINSMLAASNIPKEEAQKLLRKVTGKDSLREATVADGDAFIAALATYTSGMMARAAS